MGEQGFLKGLTKRLVERALATEPTNHLGYVPHARQQAQHGTVRNGTSAKTVETDHGPMELAVPRDRAGTFEPTVVKARHRRLDGVDDKVLALSAQGMTTREIQHHLEEWYGTEVSPTLISTITDAVLEDVRLWQSRPLETVYPILYFECFFVKSRHEGAVKTNAVHVALGVTLTGEKDLVGLWVSETDGAQLWLAVFTELTPRGVSDG
ncbi:MAG: transposase [Nitrospira sp.]|nr:transposase [Nitrospira sp.]